MPLVQEDKSLIHFLVLHEKHEEYQAELEKWDVSNIRQGRMTDPFVGYRRQVIITTEDDFELIRTELRLAESTLSASYFSRASSADCFVFLKF
jgi:hypothetical protein